MTSCAKAHTNGRDFSFDTNGAEDLVLVDEQDSVFIDWGYTVREISDEIFSLTVELLAGAAGR